METKYACQASLLQQQHMQQQQQFAERILEHLAFNSDILERWHQIGTAQGLSTDLEVATFLIQHYENTWDRAQPTDFCLTCHSPLSLTCPKCSAIANGNSITSNSHCHPDDLQPVFSHGDNGAIFGGDLAHSSKGKKRKKGKKFQQGAEGASAPDNDDDLLGLYIQFGQPHLSGNSTLDHGLLPFPEGKSPRKKSSQERKASRSKSHGGNGTGIKSHVCMHCGKTVYKLSDFKKHVRTHTREKPYKCAFCEAAFSDASSAARHRRVHTGEKPFKCDVCPSAFAQSSDLTKHMRVHTQERPWQCQLCEKTFNDSSRFARHRRQHEKEAQKGMKSEDLMPQGLDLVVS